MAKRKSRTTKKRTSKASRNLKTKKLVRIFSILLLVAVIAAVAAWAFSTKDSDDFFSNLDSVAKTATLGASTSNMSTPTLAGSVTSSSTLKPTTGTLIIKGNGFTSNTVVTIGGVPVTPISVSGSGSNQTITVNVPPAASQANSSDNKIPVTIGAGTISSVTARAPAPAISNVLISGGSAVITGNGLSAKSEIKIGKSKTVGTVISTNADGTQTVIAKVKSSSCWYDFIPVVDNICPKAKAGANNVVATTKDGQTSNTLNVNLAKASASSAATLALRSSQGGGGASGSQGDFGDFGGGGSGDAGGGVGCNGIPQEKHKLRQALCEANFHLISPNGGETWNHGKSALDFTWKTGDAFIACYKFGCKNLPPDAYTRGWAKGSGKLLLWKLSGWQYYYDGPCALYEFLPDPFDGQCKKNPKWGDPDLEFGGSLGCGTPEGDPKACSEYWLTGNLTTYSMLCSMFGGDSFNQSNAEGSASLTQCALGKPPTGTDWKAQLEWNKSFNPSICAKIGPNKEICTGAPAWMFGGWEGDSSDGFFTINS